MEFIWKQETFNAIGRVSGINWILEAMQTLDRLNGEMELVQQSEISEDDSEELLYVRKRLASLGLQLQQRTIPALFKLMEKTFAAGGPEGIAVAITPMIIDFGGGEFKQLAAEYIDPAEWERQNSTIKRERVGLLSRLFGNER